MLGHYTMKSESKNFTALSFGMERDEWFVLFLATLPVEK
jgi:hypothetical protein